MLSQELVDKIQLIVAPLGVMLYDVEFLHEGDSKILRIYISKLPDRVSIKDCESVSNVVSPMLDVELIGKEEYFLEVSSPGAERALKKIEHFKNSAGEKVCVVLCDKRRFYGTLLSSDESSFVISCKSGSLQFKYNECKRVSTVLEL